MIIILHWFIVVFASMERNSDVSMNLNCVVLLGVLLTPLSLFQCGPCTIRNTSSLRVSGQCAHLPAKHQVRGVDTCIHSARQKKENKENDVNAIQQLKSTSYRGGGYSEKLITELSDFTRVQCGCVTVQGKQIRGSNQAHDQIPCGFSGTITLTSQKTRECISVEDTFFVKIAMKRQSLIYTAPLIHTGCIKGFTETQKALTALNQQKRKSIKFRLKYRQVGNA